MFLWELIPVNDTPACRPDYVKLAASAAYCKEREEMLQNVGTLDRTLRVVLGLALIAWAVGLVPGTQSLWGWIGLVPLATGLFGTCPAYSVLGLNTCGR